MNDDIDQCPDTPAGTSVDTNGCSVVSSTDCNGINTYPNWVNKGLLRPVRSHTITPTTKCNIKAMHTAQIGIQTAFQEVMLRGRFFILVIKRVK